VERFFSCTAALPLPMLVGFVASRKLVSMVS
jgi:hypothetical protein